MKTASIVLWDGGKEEVKVSASIGPFFIWKETREKGRRDWYVITVRDSGLSVKSFIKTLREAKAIAEQLDIITTERNLDWTSTDTYPLQKALDYAIRSLA
jgi:hypothetical protein